MTADDVAALVAELRAKHYLWRGKCGWCQETPWPCPTARAADLLEALVKERDELKERVLELLAEVEMGWN